MVYRSCYTRLTGGAHLTSYSDSDMAGDVDTRKSTSGVLFFLGRSPMSWQSVKQKVVAQSSCEAEYIAAATAAFQGVWLARLLGELDRKEAEAVGLRVDNKAAIALSKNPVFHDRSKQWQRRGDQQGSWPPLISQKNVFILISQL